MKIYLVGGAIRNNLLNIPTTDKDWVVVGATPEELLFKNFKQVGKNFPVFLHPITHEEYALARTEQKFGVGYKGFKVNYSSNVTLKEDLIRRDLTINAIAQDTYGNYIDPFNGIQDIKLKILRHISPAFSEDPLRILRVARFAALFFHLGFRIAEETIILMNKIVNSKELLYLNPNRIWKETEKAMKTNNPHIFFQILHYCHVLPSLFPELHAIILTHKKIHLYNLTQNLYETCFKALAKISLVTNEIDIKFAYLFQQLSLPNHYFTYNSLLLRNLFIINMINKLCKRLNIPNYIKKLSNLIMNHQHFLCTLCYQSSEFIVQLFYKIDAWRKPIVIDKLSFLINYICRDSNIYIGNNFFRPGNYLKEIFNIAHNVSIKKIIMFKNIKGCAIRKIFIQHRINAINIWKSKLY
ncbi:CCA-adding enzyme [Buchnera aphidicola (Nipponaphis monzeni)]|uniref:CCA-adding enzyme n=1 Tax=Buchnera aphidicola (Nipponaphis monzeni) TaxID=2495405 RepID=A0A455T9R4_9GAMM|nr:tRNA CCA-pyrophosphorylase [Buchnera aphidicola]BBI01066.1 CCA-adding enzyme [Buchnera aphidicola (Nipponaphis monzeni)]